MLLQIEKGLDLIEKIISEADRQGRLIGKNGEDELEITVRAQKILIIKRYTSYFNKICLFLLDKLNNETNEDYFRFYLPNTRTLLDIFSNLSYLLRKDENKMALINISHSLFTLSSTIARSDSPHNKPVIEEYNKTYELYKDLFDKLKVEIPSNINDLSKARLKKMNLNFPPIEQILNNIDFESELPTSYKTFPKSIDNLYGSFYAAFSNYTHGNVVFYSNDNFNERFWIQFKVLLLICLTVELTLSKIENNALLIKEFEDWLKNSKEPMGNLIDAWRQKM